MWKVIIMSFPPKFCVTREDWITVHILCKVMIKLIMQSLGCMSFYEYSFYSSFTMQGFGLQVGIYYLFISQHENIVRICLKFIIPPWNCCFISMLLFPSTQMDNECTAQAVIESYMKTEKREELQLESSFWTTADLFTKLKKSSLDTWYQKCDSTPQLWSLLRTLLIIA